MHLSLHRATLAYGNGVLLHTASSGRVPGLDALYLRCIDADGIEAVGEVRINIAYLNGLAPETVLAEALALLPQLDFTAGPKALIAKSPPTLAAASAPVRMLVDMAIHDWASKRAALTLADWLGTPCAGGEDYPHPTPLPTRTSETSTSPTPSTTAPDAEVEIGLSSRPHCGAEVRNGTVAAAAIAYPTNQTLFISDDETFLRQAENYVRREFRDLKVRIGAADFAADLARLRLLRERFGDTIKLAADANGAWSSDAALAHLEALAPLALSYVEQPLLSGRFDTFVRLAELSPIPIMLDEAVDGSAAIAALAKGGHSLMAHLKLVKLGGIAATVAAARTLAKAGVPFMIGQMNEGGLATAAALHVCAALQPLHAELYGADGISNDPAPGLAYRDGQVYAPPGAGLGLAFDPTRTTTLWEEIR
jgi:L-Ala-D/L-Glu epimerase